jgi:pimeloyl-ACP methyl ester carboxylesterase
MITTSDGIRLHVRSAGSGAPLVFAHEFSSDTHGWDAQVNFFSRYYKCTVYAARGYLPSEVPAELGAYNQMRAAADLADVVRATCDGPAHVVGLSMGGFAALHFGLRYPQLARSLVLAGVGFGAKPEEQAEHALASEREADHAEANGMLAYARELAASRYAWCLRAKDEVGWAHFTERLARHSVTGMAMTLRGVLARRPSLWHLAGELRGLNLPVLLVVGDEDAPCLEPNLFLQATLPDAALCVLPRAGHLLNLEEPELFNATVFRFLAAVDRGRWDEWKGRAPALESDKETGE